MNDLVGSTLPRIWTPPLRELTPETTFGFECVEFGRQMLGWEPVPWQDWLFKAGLELEPGFTTSDPDPLFRFDTVIVIVSRQNGKSDMIKVKKLWRLYLDRARTVIGTAQHLRASEKTWNEAVELVKANPELAAEVEHVRRANGKAALELSDNRAYWVASPGRRGARSFSADDLDIDELREHQSWESWAAATPTTLARPRSQVWGWSSAGDAASIVLRSLRAVGMQSANGVDPAEVAEFSEGLSLAVQVEGDDVDLGTSLGLFEWSAHPKASLNDRVARAQANPSLGHGFLTERKLIGLMAGMPSEWDRRCEFMCQWRSTAAGGPFPDGAWEAGIDPASVIASDSQLGVCVDVSHDRGYAYVSVAGFRADGHVHVQMVARRAGTEWVLPWLLSDENAERRGRWAAVTCQAKGAPVSTLADELEQSGLPWVPWQGSDVAAATGQMWDLVRLPDPEVPGDSSKRRVFHPPQPVVDVPASTATTKPVGDSWVLDRQRSPVDCAPLIAEVGAVWVLSRPVERFVSAYADDDAKVVFA